MNNIVKKCLVEVGDNTLAGNLMCFTSLMSYIKLNSFDYCLITYKNNPFIGYYNKLNVKILYVEQFFEKYLENINSHQWSKLVYARFMIFLDDFFKQYDFTIYADIDTVCIKPIENDQTLFNEKTMIGMVPELHCQYLKSLPVLKSVCDKIGFKYQMRSEYCNAGMLYIPRQILDNQEIRDLLEKSMEYSDFFASNDQDIINSLIGNKIRYLDPIYNLHPGTMIYNDQARLLHDVKIIHYAAITKYQKFKNMLGFLFNMSDEILDNY